MLEAFRNRFFDLFVIEWSIREDGLDLNSLKGIVGIQSSHLLAVASMAHICRMTIASLPTKISQAEMISTQSALGRMVIPQSKGCVNKHPPARAPRSWRRSCRKPRNGKKAREGSEMDVKRSGYSAPRRRQLTRTPDLCIQSLPDGSANPELILSRAFPVSS